MSTIPPPRQFTVAEAAEYLLLSKDAVYELAASPKLKSSRPKLKSHRKGPRNGRIYFLQQDLDDYLNG